MTIANWRRDIVVCEFGQR